MVGPTVELAGGLAAGIDLVLDVGLVVWLADVPLEGSTVGIVAGLVAIK